MLSVVCVCESVVVIVSCSCVVFVVVVAGVVDSVCWESVVDVCLEVV